MDVCVSVFYAFIYIVKTEIANAIRSSFNNNTSDGVSYMYMCMYVCMNTIQHLFLGIMMSNCVLTFFLNLIGNGCSGRPWSWTSNWGCSIIAGKLMLNLLHNVLSIGCNLYQNPIICSAYLSTWLTTYFGL